MASTYIWRNGTFVPWEEATVHVTAHALHYGSSVFEGIRAYATERGPAVFRLQRHTQRLINGCKVARIEHSYTAEQLDQVILDLLDRNGHEAAYIRPLVFRGAGPLGLEGRTSPTEVIILTMEWGHYLGDEGIERGVDVMVSSWRRGAPDSSASLAKIGGQYVNSQFISMEAKDNGFAEGIGLDVHGYVSEGAGENLFVIVDDTVYTPGLWSSILAGITRDSVLTLLEEMEYTIRYEPIARELLYMADEMFFTGTAAEITPIRSVDRIPVGEGKRGPITRAVQEEFFEITAGRKPDRHGWLTYVRESTPANGD